MPGYKNIRGSLESALSKFDGADLDLLLAIPFAGKEEFKKIAAREGISVDGLRQRRTRLVNRLRVLLVAGEFGRYKEGRFKRNKLQFRNSTGMVAKSGQKTA